MQNNTQLTKIGDIKIDRGDWGIDLINALNSAGFYTVLDKYETDTLLFNIAVTKEKYSEYSFKQAERKKLAQTTRENKKPPFDQNF